MAFLDEAQHGYLTTTVTYDGAQSAAILVAATTGKAIIVDKVMYSADAQGTMFLASDSTQKSHTIYYGANGGVAVDDWRLPCATGENLKITTTDSGNHSIFVRYYLV
tara:strand:+ start:27 stop:347 length:321 start_codon:yes stop_codon:yes gene_type:complete